MLFPLQITTVTKAKKILKKTNSASSLIISSSSNKINQNKNILKDGANQRKRSGSLCLPSTTSGEFQVNDQKINSFLLEARFSSGKVES